MKKTIDELIGIMAKLRHPEDGCVWDKAQTLKSIVPHTIEEAYEVAEVIETNQLDALCGELGDLLFQVIFYARIAEEESRFDFSDVVDAIATKMLRRHPHVFGDEKISTVEEQNKRWNEIKRAEIEEIATEIKVSAMDGVNWHLPTISVSKKLQNKAAHVGFDWPDWKGPVEKVKEELDELVQAVNTQTNEEIQGEMGDILFACVNLARALNIDPEAALRQTNRKFDDRFRKMEQLAIENKVEFEKLPLSEKEAYWQQVKRDFE